MGIGLDLTSDRISFRGSRESVLRTSSLAIEFGV